MNQEKLIEVIKDKDFIEKIVGLQTAEEVQAAFKEKGAHISIEEVQTLGSIVNTMVEKKSTKLTESDLAGIAGGRTSKNHEKEGFWSDFKKGLTNIPEEMRDSLFGNDIPSYALGYFSTAVLLPVGAAFATTVLIGKKLEWYT